MRRNNFDEVKLAVKKSMNKKMKEYKNKYPRYALRTFRRRNTVQPGKCSRRTLQNNLK